MERSRGSIYEHDIPSLSASLEAFDPERSQLAHSAYSARSNMHSSRWSLPPHDADADDEDHDSEGPWAPPAWQNRNNQWHRRSLLHSSRSPSYYRTDRETTPSRIPLPDSPTKNTPQGSPEPDDLRCPTAGIANLAARLQSPPMDDVREEPDDTALSHSHAHAHAHAHTDADADADADAHSHDPSTMDGFVRFAIRGETLFRTEPLEHTLATLATAVAIFTRTRRNLVMTLATLVLSWLLLHPWNSALIPDVANVANMAKQFEPLMYASENVIPRSRELADASIAVQDLGESVRATNMSASTVIIDQLDDLADSLKVLSEKITSFFTHVDGDMDSILITMEWARRELSSIHSPKAGMLDTLVSNVHGALSLVGALDVDGTPTSLGRVVNDVLGHTTQQRSRATLQRTFDYLLSTLEENIQNELARADILFRLFESVDRQFHNLHRSVAREEDSLATRKDEFLASMWRNTITNKLKIAKYEKNLKLLKDVRASTLINKSELKSHIQVINSVKDQLDKARRNLVGPLIRRAQSSSFGLEGQLEEVERTYGFLKGVRDTQKHRVLRELWGEPKRRVTITNGRDEAEAEGREVEGNE
ncbi:uncharacterized protein EKO05_0006076 [Ascochyta rabiei]|uniref:Uncharacterized protein n=1 Tax=Didymella rabiei TaxID=5454 RepID=A0A163IFL0_DIDRA|nr:uncharacterized protein EKO05_0006076 [Ascochyta rabiei]KZM25740.1 hypothetical protein ST47_g3146 [Ascochyta rabiei]UPX15633.1 hypothetical protein EKO05_0006076 [Ascochyta rabiei]